MLGLRARGKKGARPQGARAGSVVAGGGGEQPPLARLESLFPSLAQAARWHKLPSKARNGILRVPQTFPPVGRGIYP